MDINTNELMGLPESNSTVGATKTEGQPSGNNMTNLLANPGVQLFLAELGASIGQGGLGEAIGKPTAGAIQRQAQAKAMEEAAKNAQVNYEKLIQALGGNASKMGTLTMGTETPVGASPNVGQLTNGNTPAVQAPSQSYEMDLDLIDAQLDKLIGGGL